MSYYIIDKTINEVIAKNTVQEIVKYAEQLCEKYYKRTRKSYMDEMISIGHGYDDPEGHTFIQLMSDNFETGVIKSSGKLVRTNIHEHMRNSKYKDVMGD